MAVRLEEVGRPEEAPPGPLELLRRPRIAVRELLDPPRFRRTERQLLLDGAQLGRADVVTRIHGRVRRRDDGREMRAVAGIQPWIPRPRVVGRRLPQHDGVRPVPRLQHPEELLHYYCWIFQRIFLTNKKIQVQMVPKVVPKLQNIVLDNNPYSSLGQQPYSVFGVQNLV